mgnify:CR=1 FL=1
MDPRRIIIIGGQSFQVGELLEKIEENGLPVSEVRILDDGDRCGEIHDFRGEPVLVGRIETLPEEAFDLAILLTPVKDPRTLVETLVHGGIPFLDASGSIPLTDEVPLLWKRPSGDRFRQSVPKVAMFPGVYSLCSLCVLEAMHRESEIESVRMFVLQGASARGTRRAMDELFDQAREILNFKDPTLEEWPRQLCFNAFPLSEAAGEEIRMGNEIRHALAAPWISVGVDIAWACFFVGFLGTIWVTFREDTDLNRLSRALGTSPNLHWSDTDEPPGILDVVGQDKIYMSQLRTNGTARNVTLRFALDNMRAGFSARLTELIAWYLKET